jgi:hypothetical protein
VFVFVALQAAVRAYVSGFRAIERQLGLEPAQVTFQASLIGGGGRSDESGPAQPRQENRGAENAKK